VLFVHSDPSNKGWGEQHAVSELALSAERIGNLDMDMWRVPCTAPWHGTMRVPCVSRVAIVHVSLPRTPELLSSPEKRTLTYNRCLLSFDTGLAGLLPWKALI
jgi:hypothetical protein